MFDIVNSGGNIGTSFSTKGQETITWETNTNMNFGFEFLFWKKLTGSIEYYYRKTTDMLYSFAVAPSNGYSSYYDNVGDMYNKGVELDLSYTPIQTKNIDWTINLNVSYLKNRLTKLHDDKKTNVVFDTNYKAWEGYNSGDFYIAEGQSIYSWYMKDFAGVGEQGQPLWYKNKYERQQGSDINGNLLWEMTTDKEGNPIPKLDEDGNKIPIMEDVWYDRHGNKYASVAAKDAANDDFARRKVTDRETTDTYSQADYYVINKTTLAPIFGGFGTSLKAYGFDFTINFTYQIGGKQYDGTYAQFMAPPTNSNAGYNIHKDAYKSWTAENPSTTIPRWQYDDLYSSNMSTRFLTDASYLNIQNINLGYTFPRKLTQKALINSLRVYVSAENVYYWSKRKGFDPRQSYSATTNATYYSPMRTISGGITLQF